MFRESWAYHSGEWVQQDNLGWTVTDFATTHGVQLVERLRTYGKRIRAWELHQRRLASGAEYLGIIASNPSTSQRAQSFLDLNALLDELLERNRVVLQQEEDVSIVVLVSPGDPGIDSLEELKPSLIVHLAPLPWKRLQTWFDHGVDLRVSDRWNVPPECWSTQVKTRSRLQYYLADRENLEKHPGTISVLTNRHGFLTETSVSNLLFLQPGKRLWSPLSRDILPGVTLEQIINIATKLGYQFLSRDISIDIAAVSDEIWMTGSMGGIWSANSINGQRIGQGRPGPILQAMQQEWSQLQQIDMIEQARRKAKHSEST